jgi:hypothetical protein
MKLNNGLMITILLIIILAILFLTYPFAENYTNKRMQYSEDVVNEANRITSDMNDINALINSNSNPQNGVINRISTTDSSGNTRDVYGYYDGNGNFITLSPSSGPINISSSISSSVIPNANEQFYRSSISNTVFLNNTSGYDPNNYNVEYHDNLTDISAQSGLYNATFQQLDISANDGSSITLPYLAAQALPTYYRPGSFIYGAATYVPNYEDSVYLSKSTGLSTVSNVYPTPDMLGGYCQQLKNDPTALELKCNSVSGNDCASSQCCVLLGGAKCVSGDEKGPFRKENYSDTTLTNKDYYYYQGKCYGNCV